MNQLTATKFELTHQNNSGVFTALLGAIDALGMSEEQIQKFCDATPNGPDLWLAYTSLRDSVEAEEGYNFTTFVQEVLSGKLTFKVEANILHAFPSVCILGQGSLMIASFMLSDLRGLGMNDSQIIAAHQGDPTLQGKMTAVTCKGCNVYECKLHPKFKK